MLNSRTTNIVFILIVIALMMADINGGVSKLWYVIGVFVFVSIHAYGSIVLDAGFFVAVKFRGAADSRTIALTFDDGPVPEKTERVLHILTEKNIRASFFCIGNRVQAHRELIKKLAQCGHVIANHSYYHSKTFDLQSSEKIYRELEETKNEIFKSIGKKPKFFRPPYGVTNPMVASAIKRGGWTTIGWSVRSFDTIIKDPAKLFARVTGSLSAGDIILFHDFSDSMLEVLPKFIDHAHQLGLKFVTVDELLNERAYE